ncbi:hypothetical protein D3C74_501100 [compost metagenome]
MSKMSGTVNNVAHVNYVVYPTAAEACFDHKNAPVIYTDANLKRVNTLLPIAIIK